MTDEPKIGSREWWRDAEAYGVQGVADAILRLLEQRIISRAEAREFLRDLRDRRPQWDVAAWAHHGDGTRVPSAPWDALDWGPAGDHSCVVRVAPAGDDRPVVAYLADGTTICVRRAPETTGPAWMVHVEQDVLMPQDGGGR